MLVRFNSSHERTFKRDHEKIRVYSRKTFATLIM